MASKNIKYDTWLDISDEDLSINKTTQSDKAMKIIDQATLESLMENIIELSSEAAVSSNDRNDHVASNEYSEISSPLINSISSNSSEKMDLNKSVINGSEWLWYWSSRPEISNFYNCNKSTISEPLEQLYPDSDSNTKAEDVKSMGFRNWIISYLPLLYSHACTFILGAATMYFILKRCMQMTANNVI